MNSGDERPMGQVSSQDVPQPLLCKECGGRRMIQSSAGMLPCPVCVPWSKRPEYVPRKLMSTSDLNLKEYDVDVPPHRKKNVMTEERRLAIQQAMKNRGPLDQEHKRKISNAVRQRYKADPSLRQHGRPKRCSVCGEPGHNKKTCPQLVQDVRKKEKKNTRVRASRQPPRCSVCGKVGHRKNACPTLQPEKNPEHGTTTPADKIFMDDEQKRNVYGTSQWPWMSLRGSHVALSLDGTIVFPLPVLQEQCVEQAAAAVQRAWEDGIRRQNLELLLPQENAAVDGGWPGGIKQQFRVALPMIESLLRILKSAPGLQGRITAEFLDETDCVGAWQSEKLSAVVFPTAETIPSLQRIDNALSGERLSLIINPQWQLNGQVISDFGFGPQRRRSEKFINSLEYVYYLERIRIMGDEVRVLRCYPGKWQVYWMGSSARESKLLAVEQHKPAYDRLVELLKSDRDTRASKSWIDRFFDRGTFDEIATYQSSSSPSATPTMTDSDDDSDNNNEEEEDVSKHDEESTVPLQQQQQQQQEQERDQEEGLMVTDVKPRDIVTGEILHTEEDSSI